MPSPTAATTDPSKEAVVLERVITRVTFEADGSSVREHTSVIRVQSDAGVKALAVLTFPYTTANQAIDVDYVRVRKPDGTVVATPPLNVLDMPADVTRVAPMYSDLHEKHVTVKGLGVGDVLEYQVRVRATKPEVRGHFWFGYTFVRDAVCKDEELEISVPRKTYVKVSSPEAQPLITEDGPHRVYKWKTASLETKRADKPRSSFDGPRPSVQVTTFRTWAEVGRWYSELQKPELAVTPAIRAKVTELTAALTGDDEKIRAIYAFVSSKIHYVSLSFGIGRFQPHAADDVLSNEYGDCKDKHTLLAAMLKAAGYEAWPALINSSRTIDPDVPSPGQFDHVITVVRLGDDLTWLDTAPEVAPFGLLFTTLRDKQALVIPEGGPPVLMCTPAVPPFPLFMTVAVTAKLAGDGTLTARFERTDRSDFELYLRAAFRSVPRNGWQDLVQQISYGSGFGGTVTNVEASSPDDTASPFRFSYDYTRRDPGDWPNRQIILPLPPFGLPSVSAETGTPSEPIELGPPGEMIYQATLELPPEYSLTVPNAVELKRDYAEYHAYYSLKDRMLVGTRRLTIAKPTVTLSQLDDYRGFEKAVNDDYGTWLKLESPAAGAKTTPMGSPDAKPWFDKATTAFQQHDLASAEDNLRQVLKVDPTYPRAHSALGGIHLARNQPERGLAEIRKELELHPDDVDSHRALAKTLMWLKRPTEAIDAWRALLRISAQDRDALVNLGDLLVRAKRYPEALQVLEPAVSLSPDSATLQQALGDAYLATKQPENALAAFRKSVELDPTNQRLNDVSYRMAEGNVALEQAKAWAAKAVAGIEAETAEVDLSNLKVDDLYRMNALAAYWDTLGWVCFRAGELEKAERYLQAAWRLSQKSAIGDHLGQLYEREGKREAAIQIYALALAATAGRGDAGLARRYQRASEKDMNATSGPTGRGAAAAPDWAAAALFRARQFTLPAIASTSSSADFFLLFGPGPKTLDVKFITGSETLRSARKTIAALNLGAEFPDQGPARIVRRAVVTCNPAQCQLMLLVPDSVASFE